jgi:UDP-N-acetylmuramoylalanine--D-glutamate ligase
MTRALVIGLAATGEAVARRLRAEGWDVVVVDDRPAGDAFAERSSRAASLGVEVVAAPAPEAIAALVRTVDLVVPSPLVDERHPAIATARAASIPIRSEIDLAAERAQVPIVAVTGTNGKTTVTSLTAAMLNESGRRASAAGNIGRTLLEAVDDEVDVLVAEVSSFQLAFSATFRPRVAVLLAVAEDHLDWHGSFAHYCESKARVFANQRADDVLVYDADDPVASALAAGAPAARVGVSRAADTSAFFRVANGTLVTPEGQEVAPVATMPRALGHDVTNALASAAASLAVGATVAGIRSALARYATLPHRLALVGEHGGVRYYDDSKATNPHAARTAVAAFPSVVLLAGGRNKGLDLAALADPTDHVRAVVAFGEAAAEVAAAFAGRRRVVRASSMREAVTRATELAERGDVVLLSPGCASFDAYPSYAARGDDFAHEVRALIAERQEADAR